MADTKSEVYCPIRPTASTKPISSGEGDGHTRKPRNLQHVVREAKFNGALRAHGRYGKCVENCNKKILNEYKTFETWE
jgi:hypothetical protein